MAGERSGGDARKTRTEHAGASDTGRRRPHNEDAYSANDELGLYVVADGVGGYAKGEVASRETVEVIAGYAAERATTLDELEMRSESGDEEARWELRRMLETAVQLACYRVFGLGELDPSRRGMSTTVSTALVRGGFVFAAHVGDSRIYRIRGRQVLQITEDHTLIHYKLKHGLITEEEAARAKQKNVITRAVGHRDYVQIDTADVDVRAGDRLLLCTDGLHQYLRSDADVAELIFGGSLDASARAAIAFANRRGGSDNITAVVVEVVGSPRVLPPSAP
jgi:serine/threonine protein phosphatase PrpC